MTDVEKTWKSIYQDVPWAKKEFFKKENFDMVDLLMLDGHISDTGSYDIEKWNNLIDEIKDYSLLDRFSNVLEIGCGAGAVLSCLDYCKIHGIDTSKKLLSVANKVLKNGKFHVSEALKIPYGDLYFDLVLSCSTFQYFPDIGYMTKVIFEIERVLKNGGKLVLLDLLDSDKEGKYKEYQIAEAKLTSEMRENIKSVEEKISEIKETNQFNPASPYAVSKITQDLLGKTYFTAYKLKIITTRMFAYFNPRRTDLFASSFAKQVAWIEVGLQKKK